MSIDINSLSQTQIRLSNEGKQAREHAEEPAVAQRETGKSSTTDTVSLSDSAVRIGKLENSVAEMPVVDTQRVEQVKQAIASGSYEIDPTRVAEKFMQFENALKQDKS